MSRFDGSETPLFDRFRVLPDIEKVK